MARSLASFDTSVLVKRYVREDGSARAQAKQAVTLHLDHAQVAAVKRLARRRRVPCGTLLRLWIADGLAKERAG